ncbi:MAG TPA: D-2-hydroxyacid dehydrogenase [Longimicrobiales bacterium]|nr:D-2-hydroxyacid dehydrogenase [Longimicrobiales bacterium]
MLRTRRLVLDMDDSRPLMRLPGGVEDRLRAALTFSWEVVRVRAPATGRGDGGRELSPEALNAVRDAEIYLGYGVPEELLRAGAGLRWIHSGAAGVASAITPALRRSGVVFTNSAGVHAPAVAETAIAMMLHFARGLDSAVRAQAEGEWRTEPFDADPSVARELAGATLGVIGYGGIGRETARRAAALGMRVLALRRRAGPPRDELAGTTVLTGDSGFRRILADADYLLLAAPETAETRGMIDGGALERMRPGAVLVNVSRGGLVLEDALVRALRNGMLRGAALDVFAVEPLPSGHPLWRLPNVLITPHVSGYSNRFWERETELIVDNLGRYLRGLPLRNLVDPDAGY